MDMKVKKEKVKGFWKDFKAFICRGNVVDMAIGVVVAASFKDIVTKFTDAFISPLIAIITGGTDLSNLKWIFRHSRGNLLCVGIFRTIYRGFSNHRTGAFPCHQNIH